MDNSESKKLALLRILQILEQFSDANHHLTQNDIITRLESEFGISVERKTIGRNLALLREAGYDIRQTRTGCYLNTRDFSDDELRILIDGALCSRHISQRQSKELANKIRGLSNSYFYSNTDNISVLKEFDQTSPRAFFNNIELIEKAMDDCLMVRYNYNKFKADAKLHKTSEYTVRPMQIVISSGRRYLLGSNANSSDFICHEIERITDLQITERKFEPAYSGSNSSDNKGDFHYKDYIYSPMSIYPEKKQRIEFFADNEIIDLVVDRFGSDVKLIESKGKNRFKVHLKFGVTAMQGWALKYIDHIEVISPKTLKKNIKTALKNGLKKYK